MACDLGLGIGCLEVFQEEPEGRLLLRGAGVGMLAALILAADVADADGVLVVVLHVFTCKLFVAALGDVAFLVDDPVVADVGEVAGQVPAAYVIDGDLLADTGVGTMDDDIEYVLHGEGSLFSLFHHSEHVTTLYDVSANDRGDDGSDNLKNLLDG